MKSSTSSFSSVPSSITSLLRATAITTALMGGVLLPGVAAAQETSAEQPAAAEASTEEQPSARKMDLSVEPPGPATPRDAYVHNGFYFRFAVGPGYLYNALDNKVTNISYKLNNFAVGANLMVGGSPGRGLAMGIGALSNIGLGAQYRGQPAGAQFQVTAGPFFDAFPNWKGPFHMGTLVGFSAMSISKDKGVSPASSLFGGGAAGWLGLDMWVTPEWSAGFNWQFGGAYMVGQDVGAAMFQTSLMLTILNH